MQQIRDPQKNSQNRRLLWEALVVGNPPFHSDLKMMSRGLAIMGDRESPICPICRQFFKDFRGRRVHQRVAHPREFHGEEAQALSAGSRRVRWDPEELAMMAAFEALHLGARNINKEIRERVLPHRTIDAIKGAQGLEAASAPAPLCSATPPNDHQFGSTVITTPENGASCGEPPFHPPAEDVIYIHVSELSRALGLTIPSRIEEVEAQVDLWCPPSAYTYKEPGRGGPVSRNKKAKRKRDYRRIQKLWRKERGRAVKEIITGIPDGPPLIPQA
ncbi:hypothetical protein E2C01_032499 [Portunus trituberculatus]|uniref:C2H2-type domain-containing protein n=1 Tax=Portunus trituberculatus TaxID=210409 RepID=A0A5B7F136_PORTR|nr:hypothetical protein [Portunus trituberculatus]